MRFVQRRARRLVVLVIGTASLIGCGEGESGRHLKQVDLTGNQLAEMLGIPVWAFSFSGGPVECWVEISEVGQKTMPTRLPEKGTLGQGLGAKESEGTIVIWWTKNPADNSGVLHYKAPGMQLEQAIDPGAFTFGWTSVASSGTPSGKAKAEQGKPGDEIILLDYQAKEVVGSARSKAAPRSVNLRLKARFGAN
jgi:hypothetical protein